MAKAATKDAVEILHRRFYEGKPRRLAGLEQARVNDDIARQIATHRNEAGLSQKDLARLVGTAPSVISRLESADYKGHSMAMLRRIAAALNSRVQVRFVRLRKSA